MKYEARDKVKSAVVLELENDLIIILNGKFSEEESYIKVKGKGK